MSFFVKISNLKHIKLSCWLTEKLGKDEKHELMIRKFNWQHHSDFTDPFHSLGLRSGVTFPKKTHQFFLTRDRWISTYSILSIGLGTLRTKGKQSHWYEPPRSKLSIQRHQEKHGILIEAVLAIPALGHWYDTRPHHIFNLNKTVSNTKGSDLLKPHKCINHTITREIL